MRNLVLTDLAKANIENVFNYIELKYGVLSRKKFAAKLNRATKILHANPEIFPASTHRQSVRKCVVTKQSTIYYMLIIIMLLF